METKSSTETEKDAPGAGDVHPMTYGDKKIILVGTAHLSRASTDLVERVIGEEKPDTVCVELCASRYDSLTQKKRWEDTDLIKVIREKKAMLLFANLLLAHFQKRIGARLGIRPGEEILRAIQCAGTSGAQIHLVDRDIRTTLSRAWHRMGLRAKFKLLYQFISSLVEADEISEADIEEMKKKDVLDSLISEMGQALPVVREVLIDERDRYLSHMIRNAPGNKVVAVIGAGHVPGVKRYWDQEIDIEALKQMPPKGRYAGWFKWGFPGLIVVLFVVGFFTSGTSTGADMIIWWAITTGTLSGLGAALALAHPLTILSAILSAPLTTLHPLIAAGWVAGLVEVLQEKFAGRL